MTAPRDISRRRRWISRRIVGERIVRSERHPSRIMPPSQVLVPGEDVGRIVAPVVGRLRLHRTRVLEWWGYLEPLAALKRLRWVRGRSYEAFAVEAVAPQALRIVDYVLEGAAGDAEGSGWERYVSTDVGVCVAEICEEGMNGAGIKLWYGGRADV